MWRGVLASCHLRWEHPKAGSKKIPTKLVTRVVSHIDWHANPASDDDAFSKSRSGLMLSENVDLAAEYTGREPRC